MLIDELRVKQLLGRIVRRVSRDELLQDDLMQEAVVWLWMSEQRRAGQTTSWYLQSCQFHLLNYVAVGRSVDSFKRRNGRVTLLPNGELPGHDGCSTVSALLSDGAMMAEVHARDILGVLTPRLKPIERKVLLHLHEGLGVRDIATRLGCSHPAIIKHRHTIAEVALRLGIEPVAGGATTRKYSAVLKKRSPLERVASKDNRNGSSSPVGPSKRGVLVRPFGSPPRRSVQVAA